VRAGGAEAYLTTMTILAFLIAFLVMAVSTPPPPTTTQAFILKATLQHRYYIRTYKHVYSALNMRFAVVLSYLV
jgi:hypothetical protein